MSAFLDLDPMIKTVIIVGLILTVISAVIAFVLGKALKGSYTTYVPFALLFLVGLVLLLMATILDKVDIMGAGYGGWGIARLFAAAVGLIISTISSAYSQEA